MTGKHVKKKKRRWPIVLGIIVVVLFAATVFLKMPGEPATQKLQPFFEQPIAHRGYFDNDSEAPENTLATMSATIACMVSRTFILCRR